MVSRLPACGLKGLAWLWLGLCKAFLAWPGLAFSLKMRTTLERELCVQEIAFSTLAGFWHDFLLKSDAFWPPKTRYPDVLFGLWGALAAFGLPWPLLGLLLASLGLPLASLWPPPFGGPWRPLGASLAPLSVSWRIFSLFLWL